MSARMTIVAVLAFMAVGSVGAYLVGFNVAGPLVYGRRVPWFPALAGLVLLVGSAWGFFKGVCIGSVSISGDTVRLGIWWYGAWRHPTLAVDAEVYVSDDAPELTIWTVES